MKTDNEYVTERVRQLADLAVNLMMKLQQNQNSNLSIYSNDKHQDVQSANNDVL
jgi:hypothetical protein